MSCFGDCEKELDECKKRKREGIEAERAEYERSGIDVTNWPTSKDWDNIFKPCVVGNYLCWGGCGAKAVLSLGFLAEVTEDEWADTGDTPTYVDGYA